MKFRRFIAAALSFTMICGAFPVYNSFTGGVSFSVSAASVTDGALTFSVYSDHAAVTGYDNSVTDVVIPDTIDGVPVTEIGRSAFMYCSDITSMVIPDTVTVIGDYAFWECRNMQLDKLPDSLTTIGHSAFYRCDQLTDIVIPEGVTEITDSAFYWCGGLKSVTMGDGVTAIGDRAFIYCGELETVDLSPNIATIGSYAFYSCMKLKELVLTDAIQSVGLGAFAECSATIVADRIPITGYQSNIRSASYTRTASPVTSYIHEIDGGLEIARADANKVVLVDRTDSTGALEQIVSLRYELPIFGGVFFGEDYNFIVFGDTNYEEDNQREVFRIVKYSKDWERLGSTSIFGANTHIAVDGGTLRMAEWKGNLYVYTCHTMYASSRDGLHHQANLQIIVNQENMVGAANDYNYASHSFDQYVRSDESGVYYADLGDAYPRTVVLHNISRKSLDALPIQGALGDNSTGVTLGGLELSTDNLLLAGNTVDQTDAATYDYNGQRNIFISVTDKELGSTSYRYLTNYDGTEGIRPQTPALVKADNDRFYMLWHELGSDADSLTTWLVKLDGSGNTLSGPVQLEGDWQLSDCQPIYCADGTIKWYTVKNTGDDPIIYQLDPEKALDPEYVPPVTTTADPQASTTTTTTAATDITETTTTTVDPETIVTDQELFFPIPDIHKGDKFQLDMFKTDGSVSKVELYYYGSDGEKYFTEFYPGEDQADFDAGDSRLYDFTAQSDTEEFFVHLVYTGSKPLIYVIELPPEETTVPKKRTPGDANLDGSVSLNDAVAILQFIALEQKYPLEPQGYINADVDGTEGVSGSDALFIQMYDAKLVELPAE